MRRFLLAAAAGALFALPLSASAAPLSTDLSSQIRVGPDGVRVGHDRYDSRRRDRRRGETVIIRDRKPSCRTVTIRERLPGGGVKIVKRRDC
jgi:hypothetical protein